MKTEAQQASASKGGQRLSWNSSFSPRRGWLISFDEENSKKTTHYVS